MTCKLPILIPCATSTQNSHQERARRENKGSRLGNLITGIQRIKHQASSREAPIPNLYTSTKIVVPSVVTLLIWMDFNVQPRNSSAKLAINLAILQAFAIRRINKNRQHQLKAGALYAQDQSISSQAEDSSSDDSFCLQLRIQHTQSEVKHIPTPAHLIANLAYCLNAHHNRNLYLRARLDTCTDVNIMPASVYRLMFKDPEMKQLAPSE